MRRAGTQSRKISPPIRGPHQAERPGATALFFCVWRLGAAPSVGGGSFLVQKLSGFPAEGLCRLPDRQKRDILLATLHAAHMGSVDAHALCNCLLAEAGGKAVTAQVSAEDVADVHP